MHATVHLVHTGHKLLQQLFVRHTVCKVFHLQPFVDDMLAHLEVARIAHLAHDDINAFNHFAVFLVQHYREMCCKPSWHFT